MALFLALKYIHVLLAITAVGSNITYAVWGARGRREPENLAFVLRGIKFLDDRVANPCYGGLLVTGLLMTLVRYSFSYTFILVGIGLFVLLVAIAVGFYSPALRNQISALDEGGVESEGYRKADSRSTAVGIPLAIIALLIVLDMVVKPSL